MPGSATLGTNLVDELVPMIDELRDLYREFGITSWQVFTVLRTWSGDRRGEGNGVDEDFEDVETELLPVPLISDNRGTVLDTAGKYENGEVTLREVSLSYTEEELTGGALAPTDEWLYKLVEAHGQEQDARYFVLGSGPQRPDRERSIGWVISLRRADGAD